MDNGKPVYKRVLLKLSGEALAGERGFGLDFKVIESVCRVIKECADMGVEIGIVIGGGNFWRGVKDGGGLMERTRADHMGMMATVMNCLAEHLAVMDSTATSLSMDNSIPVLLFALKDPENIKRAVLGEKIGTVVK